VGVDQLHGHQLHNRIFNDPRIIRGFGATPGMAGRPWARGRIMVTGAEFRDPARFQHAVSQPEVRRERIATYARAAETATGRTILRPVPGGSHVAFNQQERPEPVRPLFRPQAPRTLDPALRENPGRALAQRPRDVDRRVQRTEAGERPRLEPRSAEMRTERPRMEAPREHREAPRMEAPREHREAPRMEAPRHEAPKAEHHDAPRQESRPASRDRK
jgi:hypothetical protein